MRNLVLPVVILLSLLIKSSLSSRCVPYSNCHMPNCRCWNDGGGPGGIHPAVTPQMVLVSFQYAVNSNNEKNYTSIFEDILNPNNCSARGTFFVQHNRTSPDTVRSLYAAGHEIGVTTPSGTVPDTLNTSVWNFLQVKRFLQNSAGVNFDDVTGCRAPGLEVGQDIQFDGMETAALIYDSSCVTYDYSGYDTMIWPYTYDFLHATPKCVLGAAPTKVHKGKWQFITPQLVHERSIFCNTPSKCSEYLKTADDTFNFLLNNFIRHYHVKKTPFIIDIDSEWTSVPYQAEGTKTFLQHIRSEFDDTWVLTHKQSLDWIMNPVTNVGTITYQPWSCNN